MWRRRGASRSSLLPFLLHQWYASHLQAPWPAVQHGAGWSLAQVRLELFWPLLTILCPFQVLRGVSCPFRFDLVITVSVPCVLPHRWRGFPVYNGPYQPSWVVLSWAASCQTSILPEQGPPSVHPSTSVPVWAVCWVGWGVNFIRGGLWGLTGEASMFKKCQLYLHGHPGVITTGVPLFHLITGRLGFPSSKPTILPPPLTPAQTPAPHPHVGLHHYVPHWLMVCCLLRFTKKHCCHKPKVFTSGVRASAWRRGDGGVVGANHPSPPSHKRSFQSRIKALGWFGWSDYSSVTLHRINQLCFLSFSLYLEKQFYSWCLKGIIILLLLLLLLCSVKEV